LGDTMPCVEAMVPAPDGEIWAEDTGSGTEVVLIHGDWTDSRPTQPFSRLGDLRAVLDHFAIQNAVAVGHSGGGGTALGLAIHSPGRTRAVTLIAPGIHDYPWPDKDAYLQESVPLIAAADHDGLVSLGLRTWAPAGADPATAAMMRGAVSSWFQIGDLETQDPPGFGLLGTVRTPAVMLLGDQEYPMVTDVSRAIAARLSGTETIFVPRADHLLPLREPEIVMNAIAKVAG